MEGLAFRFGERLNALTGNFVEDAIHFRLNGRGRGGAGKVGALGDVVAQTGPQAAQGGVFEQLVNVKKSGERADEVSGVGNAG